MSSASLVLASGTNPATAGGSQTYTATVAGNSPTGLVRFYDRDNLLGSIALDAASQASVSTSSLPLGRRLITAEYEGDLNNKPSFATYAQHVSAPAGNGKLKVFILAGQSNMQGHGRTDLGRDPEDLAGELMVGGIGSLRGATLIDPLTYGYLLDESNLVVGAGLGDEVLIIKTAWGGKSLYVDFRPPSSGGTTGPFYLDMVDKVHSVLNNLATYYPDYDGQGYELFGFGWHQGWNDQGNPDAVAEYEENLVNLIQDIRAEFNVPDLPFVIANSGMGGAESLIEPQGNVADPALHPELAGTVTTVQGSTMARWTTLISMGLRT